MLGLEVRRDGLERVIEFRRKKKRVDRVRRVPRVFSFFSYAYLSSSLSHQIDSYKKLTKPPNQIPTHFPLLSSLLRISVFQWLTP
uniref:Uncharacterized protein n=1 Tax=Helianthus annuus TaxID=4232 RepID=A0A251UC26_HELAN